MKTKIFIMILACFALCSNMFSQNIYTYTEDKVNKMNGNGQKEGLWIENRGDWKYEKYYKNGILSGTYKEYNPNGKLTTFGEYKNGQMCGKWFFYESTGHLMFIFKDFDKNTNSIFNEVYGKKYIPDYKCYSISYYPNGNIQDEGTLLWSEGDAPESDFSVEYGLWKYYDETGKLIRTKVFK